MVTSWLCQRNTAAFDPSFRGIHNHLDSDFVREIQKMLIPLSSIKYICDVLPLPLEEYPWTHENKPSKKTDFDLAM